MNKRLKDKIKIITIIVILIMFFLPINNVYATAYNDEAMLETQMQALDFSGINNVIGNSNDRLVNKISMQDLVLKAIKGELDLSPKTIIKNISSSFISEIYSLMSLIRNMVLIAIFSAILNNLAVSLKQREVSELGFFISYLIIILMLMSSFNICVDVMRGLINDLCMVMQSAMPTMVTLMAMSGNVNSAYIFNPIIILIVNILSAFVKDYIVPISIFAATLQLINYISEKEILQKLSDLIKSIISWTLRTVAVVFIGIVSLQGASAPIVKNVVTRTAKATLNVVPVVGAALSGAVDTVMFWTGAVKSGFMIAIIILIILMCAVPIIKLAAFIFVFKFTAAMIQPISDARVVKALDSVGSFTAILLGACVTIAVMFVFMTMVMMSL